MKSKFLKILMFGAITVGMGMTVTSCKDTAEDWYKELAIEMGLDGTPGQGLKGDVAKMDSLIKAMQTKLNAIKSCECDTAKINKRLTDLQNEFAKYATKSEVKKADSLVMDSLEKEINALRTTIAETYVSKKTYQAAIDTLQKQIDAITSCKCDTAAIIKRLNAAEQAIVEAKALALKADTAAQNALTAANNAKTAADNAKTAADNAKTAADNAQTTANNAQTAANNAQTAADAAKALANTAKALADANKVEISKINTTLATMGPKLEQALKDAAEANARSYTDSIRIDELEKRVTDVENDVIGLKTNLQLMKDDIKDLKKQVKENLDSAIAYTNKEVAALQKALNDSIDSVNAAMGIINDKVDTLNSNVNNLNNKVDTLTITLGELKNRVDSLEAADVKLQEQIDTLKSDIKKVNDKLADIDDQLDDIMDVLAKQVTGIIVQGTYNPLFGSLRLPTGLNTNVLIAFYGEATQDIYFPTNRTGNYVREAEALTAADMKMLGLGDKVLFKAGKTLLGDEKSNAGTLYLTINPAEADLSGLKGLTLENSQGVASAIKLGKPVKSDKVLEFGYTRADNGFYEVPAYVEAADINNVQKINFNKETLKNAAKEIINKRQNANFKGIAADMYDVITDIKLDANGVKYAWQDSLGSHSVVSNYNVAATAIKPLNFGSFKDLNVKTVPGYERAMAFIDKIAGKAKDEVHVVIKDIKGQSTVKKIQKLKIKNIEIADLTDAQKALFKVSIDTTIVIDGMSYTLNLDDDVDIKVNTSASVNATTVTLPTVNLNTTDNSGVLSVPVMNGDTQVGIADIDLDDIKINYSTSTITVAGQTIPININDKAHIKMSKDLFFGDVVNGVTTDKKSVHLWVTRDLSDAAESLWGSVQDSMEDVNDMLDDVNDIVTDVNDLIKKLDSYEKKINNKVDSYVNKVKDYIEKLNGRVTSMINNVNYVFQPTMFAETNNGTSLLSNAQNYPTVVSSSITLIPTTWNLEIMAPACRKHIGVTNVFKGTASAQKGDADCKAKLTAVNGQDGVNEVIDGTKRDVKISGLQAGYTYEIAYSALDFAGQIATRKYYVTVVK